MPLTVRIVPILLKRGNSLVKGKQFNAWRSVGHPLQAARIHSTREVDELIFLDIGTKQGPDLDAIKRLTKDAFIPVTVGGGVRSIQDVAELLRDGADKVAICTHAAAIIPEASERFGRQAVVAGIDVLNGYVAFEKGVVKTDKCPGAWARQLEKMGAGEILLQCVERDGMMNGYDLDLIEFVANDVSIPVIAAGGCGSYEDMFKAVGAGASAVAVGAFFQFTDATPKGAAAYLKGKGIHTRER